MSTTSVSITQLLISQTVCLSKGCKLLHLRIDIRNSLSSSVYGSCRYKAVERLAAEEFERERPRAPTRGRTEITLCLSSNSGSRSASRCVTPSPVISQEDTVTTVHQKLGKQFFAKPVIRAKEI